MEEEPPRNRGCLSTNFRPSSKFLTAPAAAPPCDVEVLVLVYWVAVRHMVGPFRDSGAQRPEQQSSLKVQAS